MKTEIPDCDCFPPDKLPPEPGSYYTHLGTAASLADLRNDLEHRLDLKGNAIRIEKVKYLILKFDFFFLRAFAEHC